MSGQGGAAEDRGVVGGQDASRIALRQRGIVWPADLAPLLAQIRRLAPAWRAVHHPGERIAGDLEAAAHYQQAYLDATTAARLRFAGANSWRCALSPFSLAQLRDGRPARAGRDYEAIDWPTLVGAQLQAAEYFRAARRRPIAIVVHLQSEITRSPAGLTTMKLPASWFSPTCYQAYLIMRIGP